MQATSPGANRTGAAASGKQIDLMLDAVRQLSPPQPISTLGLDMERQSYIVEADTIGSIPPPLARKGKAAKGAAADTPEGALSALFLDKLGERLAFERTGTRLYSALISKFLALQNGGGSPLLPVADLMEQTDSTTTESALETLQRIRSEELEHFHMLSDAITTLGGDPTAITPCADVSAAASIGFMQVLTDPRTTLAQCLNTILAVELTDNAGWDLLSELATQAGQTPLAEQFAEALEAEQQHIVIVRAWLQDLLLKGGQTPAV